MFMLNPSLCSVPEFVSSTGQSYLSSAHAVSNSAFKFSSSSSAEVVSPEDSEGGDSGYMAVNLEDYLVGDSPTAYMFLQDGVP